ncbi:MAG: phage protein GemA/Gp16 family protein [Campylobacteraceae bacterium]
MTPKQKKLHAYLIKVCHTLKVNRFNDDETRKDYLFSRYNKESFKELTIEELKEVAQFLGYFTKTKVKPTIKSTKTTKDGATIEQIKTIEGIWFNIARIKTDRALREFIKRITKKFPLYLGALNVSEAQDVINALLVMQRDKKG